MIGDELELNENNIKIAKLLIHQAGPLQKTVDYCKSSEYCDCLIINKIIISITATQITVHGCAGPREYLLRPKLVP